MTYRTKTYIAGDWDGDKSVIEQLHKWNDSNYWSLSFSDAHELKQARDSSLNCSIKKSLKDRLDASKTFILIVGEKTDQLRAGSCQYCDSYNSWISYCARGHSVDYRSFIDYECDIAARDINNIVVIYNSTTVDRNKCPASIRYKGIHIPTYSYSGYAKTTNYTKIRDAIK